MGCSIKSIWYTIFNHWFVIFNPEFGKVILNIAIDIRVNMDFSGKSSPFMASQFRWVKFFTNQDEIRNDLQRFGTRKLTWQFDILSQNLMVNHCFFRVYFWGPPLSVTLEQLWQLWRSFEASRQDNRGTFCSAWIWYRNIRPRQCQPMVQFMYFRCLHAFPLELWM